jgi:Rrf2 family transcriptional regulator, cysteine metabolism repressor
MLDSCAAICEYSDRLSRVTTLMKLTLRSEYALLALLFLARSRSTEFISVDAIAKAQGIPARFLEQILAALKRARIVTSSKGQHGGYKLGRPAGKIALAEVIRLLDGALAPTESVSKYFYESTPVEKEKNLLKVFREIRDFVAKKLEGTTLADVR